jgi:hypothetical protein
MRRVAPKSEQIQWLQYPISGNYCRTWTVVEALRELIANAIDSLAEVEISFKKDILTITDKGEGFSTRSLVIGESEHGKSDQQIGQFGEGLKIAMLVLAKKKNTWRLSSTQFGIPEIRMRDNGLGVETLEVGISQSPEFTQKKGTTVVVGCEAGEAAQALKMFLAIRSKGRWRGNTFHVRLAAQEGYGEHGIDLDSYHPPSSEKPPENGIFVNGLWTTSSDTLFSYNMRNQQAKDSMNRDRTRMGATEVRVLVEGQLQTAMQNHAEEGKRNTLGLALTEALRWDVGVQEVKILKDRFTTRVKAEIMPFVREALNIPEETTTDKIALVLGDTTRAEVKELPARFVPVEAKTKGEENLLRWLRDKCDYKTVNTILREIREERRRAAERRAEKDAKTSEVLEGFLRLPEVKKDPFVFYDHLVDIYSRLCFHSYLIGPRNRPLENIPVFIFDDEIIQNENTQGIWLPKTKAIGLGKKMVTIDPWRRQREYKKPEKQQLHRLTETLLHEYMHALSGARDGTREHFDAMSYWATSLTYLHEALGFALYLKRDPNFLGKARAPVSGIQLPPSAFVAGGKEEWTMEEIFQSIQSEDTGRGCIPICSSCKFPELHKENKNNWVNVPMRCVVAIREGATPKTHSYRFFFAGINENIKCSATTMHRQLQTVEVHLCYKSKKTKTWKATIVYSQGYEAERSYASKLGAVAYRDHSVFMPELPIDIDESVFGA